MDDAGLPRLVTAGLVVLTAAALVLGAILSLKGIDGNTLFTIGATEDRVESMKFFLEKVRKADDG
jgi:hypothetical protein